jgi:hypothetical protein
MALMLAGCAPHPEAGKTTTIIGATLMNPGSAPIGPSVIVVSGSRILRVGTQAETPVPAGSEKIAAWGKLVIPRAPLRPGEPATFSIVEPGADKARLYDRRENAPGRIMKEGEWVNPQ